MPEARPQQNPLETPDFEPTTPHKLVVEAIGTFALVYVGVLVLSVAGGGKHLVEVALAHGLAIGVMASAAMTISGGQFNPAVSIGLLVGRRISAVEAGLFIAAQLAGGLAGGYLAKASLSGASVLPGVPDLAPGVSIGTAILVEAVLTFFLMFVIFGTAVNPAFAARLGGLAIGLTVTLDILAGGPITGAAMNPARWVGAAVPAGHFANGIVYFVGPILGAAAAGALWGFYLLPKESPPRA